MGTTETLIDNSSVQRQTLWEERDLVRRLCRVLDTAIRVIQTLGSNGYVDPEEPDNNIRPEKIISELAFC